jgi:ring-1,2-phenylacetyl-CoA epoxidase subunit PaaE
MTAPAVPPAPPVPSVDGAAAAEQHPRRQHATFHPLKVAQLDRLTDDAVAITFDVPVELAADFAFKPGQHVAVRALLAGDDVRRNYSICAPAGSGTLRIGVKRLPDGVFSSYALDHLAVGDELEVLSPAGTFTPPLEPGRAHHYGAIAAGSGITPILSILATALRVEPGSRATLIYVNATSRSIMFLEELEDLKNRFLGRLQTVHVLGHEAQDAELLSGRLDPDRLTALLDTFGGDTVDSWFLCGPMALTDMITATLQARGVPLTGIHRELFHADALPPRRAASHRSSAGPGYRVSVILDGRRTDFSMPGDTEPVLDAALRLRNELPFACTNGVCGTCRCRLTAGTVDMAQNYALEPDELARGYVLACQSYPTSDGVVMDFDQ